MDVLIVHYHEVLDGAHEQALRVERFLQAGLDARSMAAAVDGKLYRNKNKHRSVRIVAIPISAIYNHPIFDRFQEKSS